MAENVLKYKTLDLSMEMISEQLNDPVIGKLDKLYSKIIELADKNSNKINYSMDYFRNKEIKVVIEEIDKVIKDRFGMSVTHVNASGVGYAVIPVPPVNENVLNLDVKDIFNTFKYEAGKTEDSSNKELTDKNTKDKKYIKDIFKDEKSVIYHTYNSFMSLEDKLKSTGVKIDLDKAKITGLPNDYELFALADLYMLINVYELTSIELVSVLLHEVGHLFTHLEYSYRTVRNTSVILDTLRSELSKGKTTKEAFTLVYEKILDGKEDVSKSNQTSIAIKIFDKYMEGTFKLNSNDKHSYTDSEQLADQFSNKFGLGNELVSALNKMHEKFTINLPAPISIIFSIVQLGFILMSMLMSPFVFIIVILFSLLTILNGGFDSNETTYDEKIRRYKRVKNNMVKILRTIKFDKKVSKKIITDLENIDSIIDKVKTNTPILEKIGDTIVPWNKRASTFQKLEELLEDMSENSLHVASNKLKLL